MSRCPRFSMPRLLAAVLLLIVPAILQAQPSAVPFGQSSHAFRYLLKQQQLQPLNGLEEMSDPAHTLLVVFGATGALAEIPGGLPRFLDQGGALLVATDRPTAGRLEDEFGVRVSGRQLAVDPEAPAAYRHLGECPLLQATAVTDPPIFQGLRAVATNRPSMLLFTDRQLPILATLPSAARVEGAKFLDYLPGLRHPFAVGGAWREGRVLILADHSIFINDMMLPPDNDNFDFAYNCVHWLTENGRRDRVLFIDEGSVMTDFDVPLRPPALPLPTVEIVNRLVLGLEDDDVFNRLILGTVSARQILSGLALSLTLSLVGFGLFRLSRATYRINEDDPRPGSIPASARTTERFIDMRHQTLLHQGNLWETARDLCRQCLADVGAGPGVAGPLPPRIRANGAAREVRRLRARVEAVWQLGVGPKPKWVTPRDLTRMMKAIDEVKTAFREGRLHWNDSEDPA